MKTLKTLTAAATVGFAAFATTSAKANANDTFVWAGLVDQKWSTPGNWHDSDKVVTNAIPSATSYVYFHDNGTYPANIELDQDVSVGYLGCYSGGEKHRRFFGGHTLTVVGVSLSGVANFNRAGLIEVSGENTQLLLANTTADFYVFRESSTMVTNNAKFVVKGKPLVRSLDSAGDNQTTVGFTAIDGGVYEFAKFDLQKAKNSKKPVVAEINLVDGGVMKVKGDCSIGDDYNTTDINISGTKPAGGFLQLTAGTTSLGGGIKLTVTPELAWADGTDVGVIAYTGGGKATIWDDVRYRIDLAKFQGIEDGVVQTFCLYSSNLTSGKTYLEDNVNLQFLNADGLAAELVKNGNNLYVTVQRDHTWSDWEYTLPTKKANGQKYRHCLDDGCAASETHILPQLPGDYLQLDTVGWFETTYTPHLKNTTIDFVTSPSTNIWGRSLAMAGDSNFMFIFADPVVTNVESFAIYCTDSAGGVSNAYVQCAAKEPQMAYTFGGGKLTVNGVTTAATDDPKDAYADSAMVLFKKTSGGQQRAGVRVYSIKVTEKVGGEDVVKMWLVPGMNVATPTLFDLVNETYLTPKCDTGKTVKFAIGNDPVTGIMMYLR